jgi:hypothetical protein
VTKGNGRGTCPVCGRAAALRKHRLTGERLYIARHVARGEKCEGSYSDYTPPGESRFYRWGKGEES